MSLPLVICAGPRALNTATLASGYYAAGGITATVVRPRAWAAQDRCFAPGTNFIDDESLSGVEEVRAFLEEHRQTLESFNRAPIWFLQQFIKLAAVAALDAPFVFVADGDTIFARDLLATILREPIVLTTGEKFENYNRLLRAIGVAPPRSSCVANGNVFSQAIVLRELATPAGFRSVVEERILPSRGELDFSEYQIAGGLLEPELGSRRIRMFRRFDLLLNDIAEVSERRVAAALRRYDAIAIEADHHRSAIKRAAAPVLYALGRSW